MATPGTEHWPNQPGHAAYVSTQFVDIVDLRALWYLNSSGAVGEEVSVSDKDSSKVAVQYGIPHYVVFALLKRPARHPSASYLREICRKQGVQIEVCA